MYIARILYPVEVLGPGKRIGIWFCGCQHHCKGCSNPELWDFQDRYLTDIKTVVDIVKKIADENRVDGFTISGGDPFFQKDDLKSLLRQLSQINDDIIVYTGYLKEELSENDLVNITVLIDGKYVEELNDGSILRGSSNQRIYILQDKYKEKYDKYLSTEKNRIQNFTASDGIISVGIHKPKFSF